MHLSKPAVYRIINIQVLNFIQGKSVLIENDCLYTLRGWLVKANLSTAQKRW